MTCLSHCCLFEKPKGQGTNGPCTCLEGIDRKLGNAVKLRILRLEFELTKNIEQLNLLNKSLSIAAGMFYDFYATCPQFGEIITDKICPGDCAIPPDQAVKYWGRYLRERAIFEIEKGGS